MTVSNGSIGLTRCRWPTDGLLARRSETDASPATAMRFIQHSEVNSCVLQDIQCAVRVLPALRFEISEVSHILRMSRAQIYHRIGEGAIKIQKDSARTYITAAELERYVKSCDALEVAPHRPTA
jgi:hypothetical protein